MDEVLQRLAKVSIRQHQIVEHLATRQGEAEQELVALCTATRQHVPIPSPRVQATQLLPKMTAHDNIEMYLQMFENTATMEGWDRDDWARALPPLLTGEAQRTFCSLPTAIAERYNEVKREILALVGLSPVCAAKWFHDWTYWPGVPVRAQAAELTTRPTLAHGWRAHRCPGNGIRGGRSPPPSPAPSSSASGQHEKSQNDAGISRGDRVSGGGPSPRGWGASTAVVPEGGPGAAHAGGHHVASRQASGPQPAG